jgi:N-acetylglucosamine malate deacetylase 1
MSAPTLPPRVLAIAAHPDDIEYVMAGTLLALQAVGWEVHYWNLADGSCGSLQMDGAETARVRRLEAMRAAELLGAHFHESIRADMEIVYSVEMVRLVASVIRQVGPQIVLTHSPQDYMEDHMETCRIAVSAAFTHAMPNFRTQPHVAPRADAGEVAVYHAMPHGLRDGLRQQISPDFCVDVAAFHERKLTALAAHHSQQHWLEASQGMNSYLQAMTDMSMAVGGLSGKFSLAEGWRRHSHLGFSKVPIDPLAAALADSVVHLSLNSKL